MCLSDLEIVPSRSADALRVDSATGRNRGSPYRGLGQALLVAKRNSNGPCHVIPHLSGTDPLCRLGPVKPHATRLVIGQGVRMIRRRGVQPYPSRLLCPGLVQGGRQLQAAQTSPEEGRQYAEHGDLHLPSLLVGQLEVPCRRSLHVADPQQASGSR